MKPPNPWLRLYRVIIVLAGVAAAASAAADVGRPPGMLLALAGLAALAALFPFNLPKLFGRDLGLTISVSNILVLASLLYYGPEAFVLLTLVDATVRAFRFKRISDAPIQIFQSPAAAWPAGLAFVATVNGTVLGPPWLQSGAAIVMASTVYSLIKAVLSFPVQNLRGRVWLRVALTNMALNWVGALIALGVFLVFAEMSLPATALAITLTAAIFHLSEVQQSRVESLERQLTQSNDLYRSTLETMALAVDARDQIGQGHLHRVRTIALDLARLMGVRNENDLRGLEMAALLHDIGKLATPDYILGKSGALTASETETMEAHASIGADILSMVPFPYPVLPFVRHHHERWDGTGYPEGLRRQEIPLGARILAVVDCYDAMRSDRPYRPRRSRESTLEYIQSEAGKAFDPEVVQKLVANIDRLDEAASQACSRDRPLPLVSARASEGLFSTLRQNVFQDIASAQREVQAVHEISRAVGGLLGVRDTLSLLAEKIRSIVPYTACGIYLGAPEESLVCQYASGELAEELEGLEFPFGHGVTGWVAANGRAMVNVSPIGDFLAGSPPARLFKSCLAVPLLREPGLGGVITLYSAEDNGFHPNALRLVTNLAENSGQSVQSALVYENTKKHAYSDSLTGLPNLRYFKAFAEKELRRADRLKYPVTFIMMDLDRFKQINDELGHKVGDQVLVHAARMLRREMRRSDTCIRYGGDEFIGIMPGADSESARTIVAKIRRAAARSPVLLEDGRTVQIQISVGVASYPQDADALDRLLVKADERMYRDKAARQNHREGAQSPVPPESDPGIADATLNGARPAVQQQGES